ncbi:MAG: flagellar motor protein MotB [Oryzomonas sp.]|uniref:flagellar motor protein MotB n=1 Tax=Oryzomonas sp. TaxID=2855186 RepID=UPI002847B404|nr:flagellar motor protein MotB [Oryzomonas sp.]MDR3580042.1 flagellar motor protein MotB [Oryzomonas sp.]
MTLRREPEKHANHERWLVSYGDLLTLLFAVFVVLYAMSQSDKKKVEEVMQSMQSAFGMAQAGAPAPKINVIPSNQIAPVPDIKPSMVMPPINKTNSGIRRPKIVAAEGDFRQMKSSIEAFLIKEGVRDKVTVEITRRGLVVSLKEAGFFDSGSATVKKQSLAILAAIAESLSNYANGYRVEGHTDNVPIHSEQFRSNWELSSTRANNIMHLLTESYGLSPENVSTVGYGEYRPMDSNDTLEGRAKNRRVDIVFLNAESEKLEARAFSKEP